MLQVAPFEELASEFEVMEDTEDGLGDAHRQACYVMLAKGIGPPGSTIQNMCYQTLPF